ncbi:hypothetical protein EG329_004034 [Mollisiaceae sp. DMI_Dod_QoI]|nr:hypothetical protein EG329_004034 [Helotiales sp. DMI_Dod_QoI]
MNQKSLPDAVGNSPKQRLKVYPERINRVRAKKPKSRTGCKTCKIRRVKCDEERPVCLKCRKFGVDCDGYEQPPPYTRGTSLATKPLLPRGVCEVPLCILPTSALFKNELEHQYFLHFRDEVSFELSGPLPTKIWNHVILQSSTETIALRNLTIAIAALSKSRSCPKENAALHRSFAIRQYGKALTQLQHIISRSDDSAVRISLIASLLIFCFENIHGDYEQAVSQVRSALRMMRKRLATVARPYSRLRTTSSIPGLEDDILDIFVRLDNTIMSRVSTPHDSRQSLLEIAYIDSDFRMPNAFRDIVEAKDYLEHVQYKLMPYLAHLPDIYMYGDQVIYVPPKDAFDEITTHLRHWDRAFNPLLEDATRRGGSDFVATATLRLLALSTNIAGQQAFLGGQASGNPELFVPEVTEVMHLARKVVAERCFRKTFVFDCGIVPTLFVVIMNCKRREVREEAVEILRSCGERMEITWNAAAVARLGEQLLRAEDGLC